MDLELQFFEACKELKVKQIDQDTITAFLAPLKHKSITTHYHYLHSLRVGLLAKRIARFMHLDEMALFMAGVMHDCGKCSVALETLGKTQGWTEADSKEMEGHVTEGYKLLRGRFDFSADIVLWHHKFQKNGYPKTLPTPLHEYSEGTKTLIQEYGRVLALADVYDALHRVNDKFGEVKQLSDEEIRDKMFEFSPDRKKLIEELYNVDILQRGPSDEPIEADVHAKLYEEIWSRELLDRRNPAETARHVMLACALEPLSEKSGCTTRSTNVSRHLKLEYFITGAINIGRSFEDLALYCQRDLVLDRQRPEPERGVLGINRPIYQYAYFAQMDSMRNRSGGRINQGIIELLIPIVASQYMYDKKYKLTTVELLGYTKELLKCTSKTDVRNLVLMKRLAYKMSCYLDRRVARRPDAKTIYDYYELELDSSTNSTSKAHNREFISGFSTVKAMHDSIMNSGEKTFIRKIEEAYQVGIIGHDLDVGRGFLADCIAVAIYLVLSQNPKIQIIV